jgi:hypothetical protein
MPAPVIVILAGAVLGAWPGEIARDRGELNDYCRYGVVFSTELQGCLDHVTTGRIDHLDTNAARFARGQLKSCLADAGPFCAQALAVRDAPTPDDPGQ